MPIEDRNLKPGTKLVARHKGEEHTAKVVEKDGAIRYRLADGREFKSLSSAGSALMGGTACNGWRFWSVAGAAKPKAAAKAKPKKDNGIAGEGLFSRLEDGRWLCLACEEPFEAPAGVEPQGCPKGHRPEDFQD